MQRAIRQERTLSRVRGPFAFQGNTPTRAYEYPWTHQQLAGLRPGLGPLRVLEVGGALSGLQFVLSREGFEVHNVDPFFEHWTVKGMDPVGEHDRLNHVFGTDVVLHRATLPEADLHGQFDAVYCVSTIEHFSQDEVDATLKAIKDVLAPSGLLVLTIDLFTNLQPFCSRESNIYGTNVSVAGIHETVGYEMVEGDRHELYGYPEFSVDAILSHQEEYAHHPAYPQMAQLVSFRRPGLAPTNSGPTA